MASSFSNASTVPFPTATPIGRQRRPQFAPGKDEFEGLIDDQWLKSFRSLETNAANSSTQVASQSFTAQAASIPTTNFGAPVGTGFYRVSWYQTVTQMATVNSSLITTITFTDHGVAKQIVGAAMTGNLLNTFQTNTGVFTVDSNTNVTFETAYASVGATPMQYALSLILEALP